DEPGSGNLRSGGVYLRKTDASPAVRLGDGRAVALSPDRKWAISIPASRDRLVLLPTGAGESRTLETRGLAPAAAKWFPDAGKILFEANVGGKSRLYVLEIGSGEPKALTPPGFTIGPVSPDGHFAARDSEEKAFLFPAEGGAPTPLPGVRPGDRIVRWDSRG